MLRYFLAFVACVAGFAPTHRAGRWHIDTLDLDVQVLPESRTFTIAGTARLRAEGGGAPAEVTLVVGSGVVFDSARASVSAAFAYGGARDSLFVRVTAPASPTELDVTFFAHTERDLGRSLVRSQGAMVSWGARWYPVLAWPPDSVPDLEFPGTTRISVPHRWRTLAPGVLVDSVLSGDQRVELWRTARRTARSFVAAEFIPRWTTVGTARVGVYLLLHHTLRAEEYARAIPCMVRELSRFFGPYPFESFGIAELPAEVAPPGFGGRSEPGYFIAHTDALDGAGVNVPLFAHELTHMWFPNTVDSRPPGDDMMDEAIATYGVTLYRETQGGRAVARREIIDGNPDFSMRAYFHEVRSGTDEPLMADYSPVIARAKGPIVYDMLRRRVGDSAFFDVWQRFVLRGGSVSLADLRHEYRLRTPRDTGLVTFFEEWLDRTGAPVIDVKSTSAGRVTLTQFGNLYTLDVPLRLYASGGITDTVLHIAERTRVYQVRPNGALRRVDLDPEDELLLWKPRFGPPPTAPASWSEARWLGWMQAEVAWLMRSYEVRGVALAVLRPGRATISRTYGSDVPRSLPAVNALQDSLRVRRDTVEVRWLAAADDDVTLAIGHPEAGQGVVVVARSGWGGRQLAMHLAQRVAIQERWRRVPR